MKVLCDGSSLLSAVLKVSSAISTKTTSPVLECVKLSAKDDKLILSATDMEIAIEQSITADILIEGEAVVPGRYFADLIKKIGSGQIQLFLETKDKIVVKYGDNEFSLQCNSREAFPDIEKIAKDKHFSMLQGEFKDMVNKSSFCVSTEDSRPVLKGCLIETDDYELKCVALDGYRLALIKKALEEKSINISVIIPQRALKEISRLIEKDEHIFTIYVDDKKLMVEIEGTTFISKLIEGEFIKYENIIPKSFETIAVVKKDEFDSSLDRASILTRGIRSNIVNFYLSNSILEIGAKSEIGNMQEKIRVNHDGEEIRINFNPKYFTDITRVLDDEFIKIKFNKSSTPAIVTNIQSDENSTEEFLYMVLPVRTIN
ncbi:MAG: DNA polymerase III subunit beta [Bacillota bacterium]